MAWYRRFTNLFRSDRHSSELDREMGFHLSERADDLVAAGMPEVEARHEARRRFGNRSVMKERTRDVDVVAWFDALFADIRHAARALRANRGFAIVAVLSLGLGIGANTAIFSLINTVMLKSLPVRHPETLLKVTTGKKGGDYFTNPIWEELRGHPELYAGAFAYSQSRFDLAQGGEVRSVDAEWVSGDYFATLGVPAMLGRTITREDDVRGCPAVVVLSWGLWQNEFGGAQSAIGKTLMVNSHPFTVVGVVDRAFSGMEVGRQTQLYAPICAAPTNGGIPTALDERALWWLSIVIRPAAGATVAQTGARLAALTPGVMAATLPLNWSTEDKASYLKRPLVVAPAANGFSDLRVEYAGALRVLMVVVALVLLIACANVANLLLARATVRQHEAAIRLALGAGRGRLIRLMLTEAMLLSLCGAALGVLFATWGARLLMGFLTEGDDGTWLNLALDRRVLAFTMVTAVTSGVLFGLAPAWRSAQADPQAALKAQGRSVVGRSRRGIGWALVAGQVALSFVLLTSAGLLLNSFRNLSTTHAGFQRSGVLLVNTELSDTSVAIPSVILERLRALPGVRSAAFSTMTPLGGSGEFGVVAVDGTPSTVRTGIQSAINHISANYFTTIGTRVLRGRDVSPADDATSPLVALVSESLARELFGATDPIGKRLRGRTPTEVIGVVEDSRFSSLRDSTGGMVYMPAAQDPRPVTDFTLELRSDVPPASLITGVKSIMPSISPTASLEFTTLSDQVARSLSRDRLLAILATFFGGLALLLALIGLYGTMSYNVARRKNEIGIRIALGAARERLIRMVIGEVGVVVLAGLGVGALLALVATRLVASFLFGLSASDPLTWVGSAGVLLGVALLAGVAPAWRAARMNPMTALREE
ncbi:MAG TPA: ABC transporter permease [Gemmatimonadales bacterium]|jgi:predicted permease